MHLFVSNKTYHFKNQLEKFTKMIKIILEDLFWKARSIWESKF